MSTRLAAAIGLGLLGASMALAAPMAEAPASKPAKAPEKLSGPMAFRPAELDLAPGETYPVELYVPSPTGKYFNGTPAFTVDRAITIKPDARWKTRVPPWGQKTYPKVTASRDAEGEYVVKSTIGEGENAPSAGLKVRIVEPQVELIPGEFKLTIKVTSPFKTRLLHGRLAISNPDRFLQDITTREFKVSPGQTQTLVIPLPGAAPVDGEAYDFTVTVETYQGYKRKKTHSLEFPPHT